MRKFTSIAIVLALVLCFATVTFAADGTEGDPFTSFGPTLTIPAGESVVFSMPGSDSTVTITDAYGEVSVYSPYGQPCGTQNPDGSLTVSLAQNCAGGCVLYFNSTATETKTYTVAGAPSIGSGTSDDPFTEIGDSFEASSAADVWFQLGNDYYGKNLEINDPNGEIRVFTYRGTQIGSWADGVYTVSDLQQNHMAGMIFYVQSTAAEATTYYAAVLDVPGSEGNPFVIDSLPYTGAANVAEGSTGVFYAWNITESGFVTISVAGTGWECQIMDMYDGYPYYSSDMINSDDNTDGTTSVQVDAGDTLLVYINTYEKSYYPGSTTLYDVVHPAGTVNFELSFAKIGSEKAPHDLTYGAYTYVEPGVDGTWFELDSQEGHMMQMNANGMTVKIDGVVQTPDADGIIVAYVDAGVHKVQVINSGEEMSFFECDVSAKGTGNYPYDAVLGENVQNEKAFSYSGKVYAFTAPVDGTITLIMDPDADWYYEIMNLTGKVYCGPFCSADDVVKSSYALHVEAGDEIMFYIQNGAEDNFLMEAGALAYELWFKGDKEGTLGNAINVNVPADLNGIDAAAGADVYYVISSQLNGQILTIVGDANTVVTLNGTALQSNNGVFVAELTGAPTNSLVVTNNGNTDASYVASIAWAEGTESNPIGITSTGDYTASVTAGGEVAYAINAKLSGAKLTVKDASYVIVNGTKHEAKDGVVSVDLKASGATISVIVGNSGNADVSAKMSIVAPVNDNPKTGDAGILMPVVAALVSVMGTAALVIKKKEN